MEGLTARLLFQDQLLREAMETFADTNPMLQVQRVCDLLLAKWVIEELQATGDNECKIPQTETMLSFEDSPLCLSKHTQTGLMCFKGLSNEITQLQQITMFGPAKRKTLHPSLKTKQTQGRPETLQAFQHLPAELGEHVDNRALQRAFCWSDKTRTAVESWWSSWLCNPKAFPRKASWEPA